MATWLQLSQENFKAAQWLFRTRCYRASASRAYYAAYAAVTSELRRIKGVVFSHGHNPSHGQLLKLVRGNLRSLGYSKHQVGVLSSAVRSLQRKRVEADYVPGWTIGHADARNCLRDARMVLQALKVIK